MELREFAAREVSTLVDRLAAHADGLSQDRLARAQKEHDAAIQGLSQKHDAAIRGLSQKHDAAIEGLRQKHDGAIEGLRQKHEGAITGLRQKLETQSKELVARTQSEAHLAATAAESRSQIESLRFELDVQRIALEQQRAESERQAAAAADHAADHAALEDELRDTRAALDAAKADASHRTRQFESTLDDLRAQYANTIREQALARMALPLDELLAVYQALSSATTPHGVLNTIVAGLSKEFARVALFRVRGSGLECVSHAGFEFEGQITKVVIPTGIDSLMTRALSSRRLQSFLAQTGDQVPPGAPFRGTPSCALALPIILGDTAVAVIYADDSDQLEFASVPAPLLVKFAELVWQHATLVLQRATAAKKALAIAPPQTFDRPA
jgi:hypothetical protein